MSVLEEKVRNQVRKMFAELKEPVNLIVFTQSELIKVPGIECESCKDNRLLMEEVTSLSDKLSVEIYDFIKDTDKVAQYQIDKIPATIVKSEKDYGIRLYGLPAGYEFPTLLNAIQMVSTGKSGLSEESKDKLKSISKSVHIQVFVTLTCPYCSSAVALGHRMAYDSEMIKADMVKPGAVVVDVGTSRVDDPSVERGWRWSGDVAFDEVKEVAAAITPVPGGVGPLTIAWLLKNSTKAARRLMSGEVKA